MTTTELLVPLASASRNQVLRFSTGVVNDTAPCALVCERPTKTQPGRPTTCAMSRTKTPPSAVAPLVSMPLMVADVPAGTTGLTAWAESTTGPADGEVDTLALADGCVLPTGAPDCGVAERVPDTDGSGVAAGWTESCGARRQAWCGLATRAGW